MFTRYQARSELYNKVFDEPNMLECILQNLNPSDIVRFSLCGKSNLTRFHDTIETILVERHNDAIREKVNRFCCEITAYVDQALRETDNLRILDNMFEFILDNIWYKQIPTLKSLDKIIETKLIQLALNEHYSHSALNYLSLLFDIHVKYLPLDTTYDQIGTNDPHIVEYIVDSNGHVHFI